MSKNIDLGTFTWDISKLEAQIVENRRQMEAFSQALKENKKALNEEKKEISELGKQIALMQRFQTDLNKQKREGKITEAEYTKAMADSSKVIADNESKIKELASTQSAHIRTIVQQEQSIRSLRQETNELNKLFTAGRTELSGNENAYRDLNKELNALKTESKNLGAELVVLKREGKENTDEYKKLEAQWKDVSAQADKLNDEFKALDKAVGDNQRSVGDYTDSIKRAFSELPQQIASGDIKGAFDTLKTGFTDLTAFVKANPLVLLFAGIAAFVTDLWQYNKEVKTLNLEVERLTGLSGEAANQLRINGEVIRDTFGRDFAESIREMNSLMLAFNVSAEEAFDIYNKGLIQGGAANSEFGDSIREYSNLFAQNGYSAQEFVDILNAGIDLNIYSDKLPDAIKEAGLALNEQTKAARDALVNAFGASFSDDILRRVKTGETTVKEALEEISSKAKDANLNQQQLAQLTADLFKGAGEDAGGALTIFEAINDAQQIQIGGLTELEAKVAELSKANKDLEEAKDKAYNSDEIQSMQQQVQILWKSLQKLYYDFLVWIQKADRAIIASAAYIRGAFKAIPEAAGQAFLGVLQAYDEMIKGINAGGNALSRFFKGDFDGAKAAASDFINTLPSMYGRIKAAMAKGAKAISGSAGAEMTKDLAAYDARQEGLATINRRQNADGQTGTTNAGSAGPGKKAGSTDANKALEEQFKKEMEALKQLADERSELAKIELAEYISKNAAILDSEQRLTEEKIALQNKYLDEVLRLQNLKLEAEKAEALITAKTEQEKLIIQRDFANRALELQNDINEQKAEIQATYAEQLREDEALRQAIEFQQQLVDLEEKGATRYEIEKAQAEQQRTYDLAELERQRAADLISLQNYENQKKLIESQYAATTKQINEAVTMSKIDGYGQVFGAAREAFGEQTAVGKAAAIAETTINTYKAAQSAYAALAGIPVVGPALGTAAAALAVVSGLKNVQKIVSTKAKFASGGLIQGPSHANGGVPINTPNGMIEAEGGEIIINKNSSRLFAKELSAINEAGGGKRIFASGGLVSGRLASVQKSISPATDYSAIADMIADAVMAGAAAGTAAGSQQGIADLNANIRIQQSANF